MMKSYHKNPRKISGAQLDDLEVWLAELGDLAGVVHDLNSNEIIGGNQRSEVFDINQCEIELTHQQEPDEQGTVAHGFVVWRGNRYAYRAVRWTAEQCEKANIIANKAGGAWDLEILNDAFARDDLLDWGFEAWELDEAGEGGGDEEPPEGKDAEPQTSRAEELRQAWAVELGQLWRLPSRTPGQEHRLICGDCTDAAVVERVMGGEAVDAVATDPPYAIYGSSTGIGGDITDNNMVKPFMREVSKIITSHLKMRGHAYIFCDWRSYATWWEVLNNPSLKVANCIVWDKGDGGLGAMYTMRHEFALFCERTDKRVTMTQAAKGRHRPVHGVANVQRFNIPQNNDRLHNAAKPVDLIEVFIKASSDRGGMILEPFSGSGTTIIAAENLARQCRAIEISPAYVAVALQRYKDAFNIEPELIE